MEPHAVVGRDVAALLNPRPVVLVTAGTAEAPEVASVAWVTPLSHDPALVGVAMRDSSVTCRRLRATGVFVVNVMGAEFGEAIDVCGASHGGGAKKLAEAGVTVTCGHVVDAPCVAEAISWLECAVRDVHDVGDHLLTVGEVVEARTACGRDERGLMVSPDTLLCLQHGSYGVFGR